MVVLFQVNHPVYLEQVLKFLSSQTIQTIQRQWHDLKEVNDILFLSFHTFKVTVKHCNFCIVNFHNPRHKYWYFCPTSSSIYFLKLGIVKHNLEKSGKHVICINVFQKKSYRVQNVPSSRLTSKTKMYFPTSTLSGKASKIWMPLSESNVSSCIRSY